MTKKIDEWKELTSKEWIVQGTEACHFLIHIPAVASTRTLWKRFGFGYELILSYINEGFCYWQYDKEDTRKLTEYILAREKTKPGLVQQCIEEWKKDEQLFLQACQQVDRLQLSTLSNKDLEKELKRFCHAELREWGLSIMIDAFSLYSEKIIIPLLERLAKKYNKKISEILPILTSPVNRSFTIEESISFFKLLQKAQEQENLRKAVSSENLSRVKRCKHFYSELQQHTQEYFWIKNSYLHSFFLDESFFLKRLSLHLQDSRFYGDISERIKEQEDLSSEAKRKKEELYEELRWGKDLQLLISLIEKFAWWQDQRKKNCMIASHYLMLFLDEGCRRRRVDKEEVQGLLPEEFLPFLNNNLEISKLKERTKESFIIYRRKGKDNVEGEGEIEILTGKKAGDLLKLLHKKINQEVNDVRGMCASPGRAEGKVRIIMGTKDLGKMQEGDILVSSMTRPELVPAMRKAAAVVTDEGGLTCHAAIVSRELKKPCVVGTRIATKAFKDGELVEVNADHGMMRKVV